MADEKEISNAGLELLCSGFLDIQNSSNKGRIGTAALIQGRCLLFFWSQMRRFFGGGAIPGEALIRVNTVLKIMYLKPFKNFTYSVVFQKRASSSP